MNLDMLYERLHLYWDLPFFVCCYVLSSIQQSRKHVTSKELFTNDPHRLRSYLTSPLNLKERIVEDSLCVFWRFTSSSGRSSQLLLQQ